MGHAQRDCALIFGRIVAVERRLIARNFEHDVTSASMPSLPSNLPPRTRNFAPSSLRSPTSSPKGKGEGTADAYRARLARWNLGARLAPPSGIASRDHPIDEARNDPGRRHDLH